MKWIVATLAAIIATTAIAQTPDPQLAQQNSARAHREAQLIHAQWYRGFVGDGINECRETRGTWPPTHDLVREGFEVHLAGSAQLAPGHYLEIYTDSRSTTLVYSTSRSACQQVLEAILESRANGK